MSFVSGSVTLKRFAVQTGRSDDDDERLLKRLAAHAIDADRVQTADKCAYGWFTGQHILDTRFDLAKNALADGLHFALRIDTHKPPADLVRSYRKMNEEALLEASGRPFLAKAERIEARDKAIAQADAEARRGAFRQIRQVPVFWDRRRGEVYLGSAASTVVERFGALFRTTFGRSVSPLSAGELAARWAAQAGESAHFDACRPAQFIRPPHAPDADGPDAPDDPAGRDFLGTEWLTWLWYAADVESPSMTLGPGRSVTVLFEKSLQLECAFGLTGTLSISADSPTRLPETPVALAGGKLAVRAGFQVAVNGDVYALRLRPDAMNLSGVQLPAPGDEVRDPRAVFEDRMDHLRALLDNLDALYAVFLRRRLSSKWSQTLGAIRTWIASGAPVGQASAGLTAAS